MKKFLSLILAVVMVATVFTACGSSENKTGVQMERLVSWHC